MDIKACLEYLFLRKKSDARPLWAINLGIHAVVINNEVVEIIYPRLRFNRKFGSYITHPFADESTQSRDTKRFHSNLEQLRNL